MNHCFIHLFRTHFFPTVLKLTPTHFLDPNELESYFPDLFPRCGLLLFAAAMWHPSPSNLDHERLMLSQRDRGWERKTERELDSSKYTGHRAAVSLTLCSAAVKFCCFNWSQTLLNTAVRSSQPDPKTTDTPPHTYTHTRRQWHILIRCRERQRDAG